MTFFFNLFVQNFFQYFFMFFRFIFFRNLNDEDKQRNNFCIWHMSQNNNFTIIFFIKKQFFNKINIYTNDIYFFSDNKNGRKNRNKFKNNHKNKCKQIDKILKFFKKFNALTLIAFHLHMHLKDFQTLRFQKNSLIDNINALRFHIFLKEEVVFFKNIIIFKTVQTFIVCEFRKIVFWKTLIQFKIHKLIILIKKIKSLNELHTVNCLNLKNCDENFCFKTFHNLNQKKQRRILNIINNFLHKCINI